MLENREQIDKLEADILVSSNLRKRQSSIIVVEGETVLVSRTSKVYRLKNVSSKTLRNADVPHLFW